MHYLHIEQIQEEILSTVDRAIKRVKKEKVSSQPFHDALFGKSLKFSKFERSFSTSLGQGTLEKISMIAANLSNSKNVERQKVTNFSLDKVVVHAVDELIRNQRSNNFNFRPNWQKEIFDLSLLKTSGDLYQCKVISDIYFEKDGMCNFISLKTPKPNIDQAMQAKRDLLLLKLYNQQNKTFFAFHYNPYGIEKISYSHSPSNVAFNIQKDEAILIGKEYWDYLAYPGFYKELLNIMENLNPTIEQKLELL